MVYSYRREYDAAVQQFKKSIELEPTFYHAYEEMYGVEIGRGRTAEAVAAMQAMRAVLPGYDDTSGRARLAAQQGRQAEAHALIENWIEQCARGHRPGKSCYAAQMYAGIGDKDQAFRWLGKAYEERNPLLAYAKVMAQYDSLRSDPRFGELLHRLGL